MSVVLKEGMKAAYGYVRVSTEGQAGEDAYGIDLQKSEIQKYATEHRYQIVEWFVDSVSGTVESRPELDRFIEDVYGDHRKADTLICFKSDRIARDTKLYFYILYRIEKKGIRLICINEDFGTDNQFANLYRSMIMFVAEQERKNIVLRTSKGRDEKRKKGGYVGGMVPYGYVLNKETKELEVCIEEKWVVLYIFWRRSERMSYGKIAAELNRRGYRKRNGGEFNSMSIYSICQNTDFYAGYIESNGQKVRGKHPIVFNDAIMQKMDEWGEWHKGNPAIRMKTEYEYQQKLKARKEKERLLAELENDGILPEGYEWNIDTPDYSLEGFEVFENLVKE